MSTTVPEFEVFIAYHGTNNQKGSLKKAEEIYNFLTSNNIKCFFNPITNGSGRFGDTPFYASHSKLFLLVANSTIEVNNYSEISGSGLYNEIDAFRGAIFNSRERKGSARVYAYDGLSASIASRLDVLFNMTEHFEEDVLGKTLAENKLIQWVFSSLEKKYNAIEQRINKRGESKMDFNKVIDDLTSLQNNYICYPTYTTTKDHMEVSKESDLTKGGTAEILTNSLAFDSNPDAIGEILQNIKTGATYIYFMPNTDGRLYEILDYVTLCLETIKSRNIQEIGVNSYDILNRIIFKLFPETIPCIYNFALFGQLPLPQERIRGFRQGWWYINPESEKDIMIANELDSDSKNDDDKSKLNKCFENLKKLSISFTAQEASENALNIKEFIKQRFNALEEGK